MTLAIVLVSFLAAALPTSLYVAIAWWIDRYEREPLWLLALTFLYGAIPAIVAGLVLELLLGVPVHLALGGEQGLAVEMVDMALVAPVVEELLKAVPLMCIFLFYRRELDGLVDGLVYGAVVGFGFAMTEDALYYMSAYETGGGEAWLQLVFLRGIVFGLTHSLFTSMFGLGLAVARFSPHAAVRCLAPVAGLAAAIGLHMTHNFFAVLAERQAVWVLGSAASDWLGAVFWMVLMFVAGRSEAKIIREELAEEVAAGLLPADVAFAAGKYRARVAARLATFSRHGSRRERQLNHVYALAAELAFKKHQARRVGDEGCNARLIAQLREQIRGVVATWQPIRA